AFRTPAMVPAVKQQPRLDYDVVGRQKCIDACQHALGAGIVAVTRDDHREPNRCVDKDGHFLRRRLRPVSCRYSCHTASPTILSLSRAMLVGGPSSMRSKKIEMSALGLGFGLPRSLAITRRTY